MQYEQDFYKTYDGSHYIEFLFVNLGEGRGWRAYIISGINFNSLSPISNHFLFESDSAMQNRINNFIRVTRSSNNMNNQIRYICWDHIINSLDNIKTIARFWAEINSYYLNYGGDFNKIQEELKAKGVI